MPFPVELQHKIEMLLDGTGTASLGEAATQISARYRRTVTGNFQIGSDVEAKAYLAARFPATYTVVDEVLTRLNNIWPEMAPATLLDLGAGPGTATLAAFQQWPELQATLVECNSYLSNLGGQLLNGQWLNQTVQGYQSEQSHDIVIASYVFNEIDDFEPLLEKYWRHTNKAFVLIEPGTPQGYGIILKARDFFLANGAFIAAPCPHHFTCPLKNDTQNTERWCHFSKRVARSQLHRRVKEEASLAYEDEKFSYLVATREKLTHPDFRTLGHPHGEKVISLETCQRDGSFRILQASKRDANFKRLKKLDWGDAFYD